MTGTSQGGKKAAETRGHDSLSKAGEKGGQASSKHAPSHESKSSGSIKKTNKK